MNGKVLHLGDPGECKQFLDRISPQLHHLVAVQWNTLRYLRYTGPNLFDVPHPLQRQRYHLLDRDPQWHNVFLSKKTTKALWQPRARVPKKIRFLLARNKVTTHLQSCWWSLPENACHLQHKDTCQWSLSHSEIYQPILSIVP